MLMNTKSEGSKPTPDSNSDQAGSKEAAGDLLESIDFNDDGADVLDTGVDEFSAAMESIGQDTLIGQVDEDDDVYDEEDDEADPFADVDESDDDEAEADDVDEDEEEADEEESEEEDEDDSDEEDEVEEAEDEEEVDDNDDTPQPADLSEIYARLNKNLGLEIDSPESLATAIESEVNANQQLIELYDKQPQLLEITRAVMGGKSIGEAVIDAIGELDEDSPDVIRAKARKEALQEAQAERLERAQEQADKDLEAFQKAHKMTDDELKTFRSDVARYVYGDPRTGQLPSDFLAVMHRGLRYDKDVAEAQKKGEVKGKNEAVRAKRKKKKGDGLPTGRSGSTNPNPAPREASLENLAAQLTTSGVLENL